MSGDWLQYVITVFSGFCYVTVAFYVVKAVLVTVPPENHQPPFPEGLALTYLAAATWFTIGAVAAIPRFTHHCIDVLSYLPALSIPKLVVQLVALAATFMVTAFICNFARSLYMLKSLDHGVYEPVPDWKQKLTRDAKGYSEFVTRLIAAILFLVLEYQLKAVAHPVTVGDKEAALASDHFAVPALVGLVLYVVLMGWWTVARRIVGDKVPGWQLVFYLAGLLNSVVLWVYSQRTGTNTFPWIMVISALVSFIPSLYMLWVVGHDIYGGMRLLAKRT